MEVRSVKDLFLAPETVCFGMVNPGEKLARKICCQSRLGGKFKILDIDEKGLPVKARWSDQKKSAEQEIYFELTAPNECGFYNKQINAITSYDGETNVNKNLPVNMIFYVKEKRK